MTNSFVRNLLRPDLVKMHLEATDKTAAIRELVGLLNGAGLIRDVAEAERVVLEREQIMSTGMECGIAIPHGKTNAVNGLVAAVALKPEGIDFDCADAQPARVLIVTLSPREGAAAHLRFMAEITRLLRREAVRERVLQAKTPDDVLSLLSDATT